MNWRISVKYKGGNPSLGAMISKYDSKVWLHDKWVLLVLFPANGFGF